LARNNKQALGPEKARKLEAYLNVESPMNALRGAVRGDSTTARQLFELGLAGGGSMYDLMTGSHLGAGAIGLMTLRHWSNMAPPELTSEWPRLSARY
jgi:hypothetical protein